MGCPHLIRGGMRKEHECRMGWNIGNIDDGLFFLPRRPIDGCSDSLGGRDLYYDEHD